MSHILILDELKTMLEQANVYSHAIGDKLDNNEFHGQEVGQAEQLQEDLETLVGSINTSFRTDIETLIGNQESLLGI